MEAWSLTCEAGPISYSDAREIQVALVELRSKGRIADTLLFLEHEPVITRGRGLQWTGARELRHMPVPLELPAGCSFSESERGGDLTYHGPGQLVIYPIFSLKEGFSPAHDIAGFLRCLEQVVMDELVDRGLTALRRPHATGIWLEDPQSKELKKVASIGIAVRKWITYHGVAINCVNDLAPFRSISPCGFHADVMTRLSDWIQLGAGWRAEWEVSWVKRMAAALRVRGDESIKQIPVALLQGLLREPGVLSERSDLHEKLQALSWSV